MAAAVDDEDVDGCDDGCGTYECDLGGWLGDPCEEVVERDGALGGSAPNLVDGLGADLGLAAMSTPAFVTWLSSPLMVAGTSQLVLFTQLDTDSAAISAALAAVLLNSRFVIYGAALSRRFTFEQP